MSEYKFTLEPKKTPEGFTTRKEKREIRYTKASTFVEAEARIKSAYPEFNIVESQTMNGKSDRQLRAQNWANEKTNNISQKYKSYQIKAERQSSGEYLAKVMGRMQTLYTTGLNDREDEAIDAAKQWVDSNT